jgi:hypothetical protein
VFVTFRLILIEFRNPNDNSLLTCMALAQEPKSIVSNFSGNFQEEI